MRRETKDMYQDISSNSNILVLLAEMCESYITKEMTKGADEDDTSGIEQTTECK